jgi:hypothetical protein
MATKASENKSLSATETKTVEAADFLSGYEGKSLSVKSFEEAYPGRGEEIFRVVAKAGGHGEFPISAGVQLGMPKKAANRNKINEAVAKLNLEAK